MVEWTNQVFAVHTETQFMADCQQAEVPMINTTWTVLPLITLAECSTCNKINSNSWGFGSRLNKVQDYCVWCLHIHVWLQGRHSSYENNLSRDTSSAFIQAVITPGCLSDLTRVIGLVSAITGLTTEVWNVYKVLRQYVTMISKHEIIRLNVCCQSWVCVCCSVWQ